MKFSRRISLDELAQHTPWPARLLSLDPDPVRHKTPSEVMREFDRDKWGGLLQEARRARTTLAQIEALEVDPETPVPFFENGEFFLAPYRDTVERHLQVYAETLSRYSTGASALVELGAGFGSKILRLAGMDAFSALPLIAAELTPNGRELLRLLAENAGQRVEVGTCDFRAGTLEGVAVPPDAVIFTSYSVHYVPELSRQFVRFLAALKPRIVVHFEPCFDHLDTGSLHDLLCRSYILRNDYNRNLARLLESCSDDGEVEIVSVRKKTMGANPLLPMSVIAWRVRDT